MGEELIQVCFKHEVARLQLLCDEQAMAIAKQSSIIVLADGEIERLEQRQRGLIWLVIVLAVALFIAVATADSN